MGFVRDKAKLVQVAKTLQLLLTNTYVILVPNFIERNRNLLIRFQPPLTASFLHRKCSESYSGKTLDCNDGSILFIYSHVNSHKPSPPMALLCTRMPLVFITSKAILRSLGTSSWSFSLLFPLTLKSLYLSIRRRTPNHSLLKIINCDRSWSSSRKILDKLFSTRKSVSSM